MEIKDIIIVENSNKGFFNKEIRELLLEGYTPKLETYKVIKTKVRKDIYCNGCEEITTYEFLYHIILVKEIK